MTQPAPTPTTQESSEQPPRYSHCIEHTRSVLTVVTEDGKSKTVLEHTTNMWVVGQAPSNDAHTRVVAIFRMDDGSARIYIAPNDGSEAASKGVAFRVTVPAQNIACFNEIMTAGTFSSELEDDDRRWRIREEEQLLLDGDQGEDGPEASAEFTNGSAPSQAAAVGQS